MSYTTFDLCARIAGVCAAAEMKVGVTHIGTLSVWLVWLWDSVMDISSELSTQASSVLTECLRWHFMCLICKVRGTVFAFRSTLLAYLWTDISRISRNQTPDHALHLSTMISKKWWYKIVSSNKSEMLPGGCWLRSACTNQWNSFRKYFEQKSL